MSYPNLIDKLHSRLTENEREALLNLEQTAREQRLPLYLVGGSVRDLLLDRPLLDLDFTVEGEAPAVARQVAAALGARCVVHATFGTATLKGTGFAFDIAMARAETYPHPGALPRVRPAAIRDDLYRRDFTVNAVALALTGKKRGEIIDPFQGVADLKAGLVRVLHDRSFVDDATRILRAARYESRLGFSIEEGTLGWLRRDTPYLDTISGTRLRHELTRILQEDAPERALLRLQSLKVLRAVHPALTFDQWLARAFAAARDQAGRELTPLLHLAVLAAPLSEDDSASLAARLSLTRPQRQAVEAGPRLPALTADLAAPDLPPSRVAELLAPFPAPALWAFALTDTSPAALQVLQYLRDWRYVKSSLDGNALRRLGVPEGPELGELLKRLRAARIDGQIRSRDQEIALVQAALAGMEVVKR
ncbi:MAG: CCA tRNA nucleotidyltransferase [Chloroflexi bacterium]|nr:CCA tRNA nucleotidyltransferase [Chloroflexota bacterium]